jgi:MFS family permease
MHAYMVHLREVKNIKIMLKRFVYKTLKHRHFWRDTNFDELGELYINTLFRGLALSITGLFVPVYLLQLHYPITPILELVAWYFTLRGVGLDILSAYTVARFGPKHTLAVGYGLLIASTVSFLTLPHHHWPVWLLGGLWGASASFFFVPFNVGFSKVKHSRHGGKEVGYVNIMDKLGQGVGPLVGGIVATIFGGQYVFVVGVIFLIIGIVPLFKTAEPIKLKQRLDFRGMDATNLKRDVISFAAMGIENNICLFLWPLFLGLFVITDKTVYAKLGVLTFVSLMFGIFSAYVVGRMIDHYKGRKLLRYSAITNSLLHLIRPFVASYPSAFGINLVNEFITPGYRMPYFKAYYDASDDYPGHRIVYLSSLEAISSMSKATMWWLLFLLSTLLSARYVTTAGFLIAAVASLVIMLERYKSLNRRPIMKVEHE